MENMVTGKIGDTKFERSNRFCRYVHHENIPESFSEKVFGFIGISTSGNEDAGRLVGERINEFFQWGGWIADVPSRVFILPSCAPEFLAVNFFLHGVTFSGQRWSCSLKPSSARNRFIVKNIPFHCVNGTTFALK